MRALIVLSSLFVAGSVTIAAADTVSSTAGPGASVAILSGSNGGTTIVIDSQSPCRTESGKTAARSSGSNSTTIISGAGGLSGTTTAGPGGTSVTINPGSGGTATTTSSSASNVAAPGECVVIIRGPSGK